MSQRPPTDPFSEIPIAPPGPQGSPRRAGAGRQALVSPPFSRQHLPPPKKSFAATAATLLGLAVLIYLVCGYFAAPFLIQSIGSRTLARRLDRPVTIGHAEFNPFTLTLTLANGIIGPRFSDPADKVDPILSFSTLRLDLEALSLVRRALICQELTINQPFLHLVHTNTQGFNVTSLLPASVQTKAAEPPWGARFFAALGSRYSINNILVTKGEILFDDQPTAKTHRLQEINFSLPVIANIEYQRGQTKPHFAAVVNGIPILMSGQAQMATGAMTASLSLKMNKLDLAAYQEYLPPTLGIASLDGQADLDLNLLYAAAAPPAERFSLAGAMTLRDAKVNSEYGQFSVDSGLVTGGFSPAANRFQAEEINLRHPVWQRGAGQTSLLDTLQPPSTPLVASAESSWSAKLAGVLLPDPTGQVVLPVNHLQITNGEIRQPRKSDAEAANDWRAIDVSITTAQSTGSSEDQQQQAFFTLNAQKQAGSSITLQGSASTLPFAAKGLLVVNRTGIGTMQDLWQRAGGPPLPIKSGEIEQVQTNFSLTIDPAQHLQFLLDPLSIQARDLRIERDGHLLEIPVWQSDLGKFTSSDPTLHLGEVQLQQATFTCRRQSSTAAWQGILSPPAGQALPTMPIEFNSLELTNATLLLENQGPPDVSLRLERLDLRVDNFAPQKENTLSAAAMLDDKYPLQANGTFSLTPFSASLTVQASELPLSAFRPILARYFVSPINGILSAEGILNLPSLEYRGKWTITSLSAPPISCRSLAAEGATFILRPLSLTIDRLSAQGPSLPVTANESGMPHLPALMQPGWQPAASTPEAVVAIKSIEIDDGTVIYDLPAQAEPEAVNPRTGLTLNAQKVSGSLEDFVVAKGQAIPFSFKGTLETRAEFAAQGILRPFSSPPGLELKSQVTGLPIVALAPLLDPYWGFSVNAGTLDFENQLTYEDTLIQDSALLSLHELSFGRPLASQAIKAIGDTWQSLPLVQAMLQDTTDTVKLTVPIDGRTDTGFTYQTALKAFLNQLLLKATVSPANLLSSSENALNEIVKFQPGGSQLEAAMKEQMLALVALLQDRPLLGARLVGFADSVADSHALLKSQKVAAAPGEGKAQAQITEKRLLALASKRAQAVQTFLTAQGVSPKQIRLSPPEMVSINITGQSGCRVAISFVSIR